MPCAPGETAELRRGGTITVQANGDYRMENTEEFSGKRGPRVFVTTTGAAGIHDLENYAHVLFNAKQFRQYGQGVLQYTHGDDPGDDHPDPCCGFCSLRAGVDGFPGARPADRHAVVGLLVVPLQLALIPLLKLHLNIGIGKGYLGVWMAHTGFGMPLAIYLLRNYMAGLPRDLIENARVDGATEFQIFTKLILPLSFPALASFAIFQFLWTWNDLLVAKVFLIDCQRPDHGHDQPHCRAAGDAGR